METKFTDLHALLRNNTKAWRYFNMLPSNIRDQVNSRAHGINTFSGLRACAEGILHGND